MALKNYRTEVDYWKSIGEIQALLFKYGASHVNLKSGSWGPEAITFTIELEGQPVNFLLDSAPKDILVTLQTSKTLSLDGAKTKEEKALRVGWRIVKDWISAQMAFIEARRSSDITRQLITVFLPYAVNTSGETLSARILQPGSNNLKLLN